ncbi:MAG: GSU2403 family nucleotidyltransferase fold protein [Roseateles sp.]
MVAKRSFSTDLSLGAQTSYAELLDMARSVEQAKFGYLRGSFHRRQIKGKTYVYFNFRDVDGHGCSIYVGPEGERVQRLIDEFKQRQVAERLTALTQRAQACMALGCSGLPTKHLRLIQKLAGYGFFRRRGVLVGIHAFVAMGDMLGLRWTGGGNAMCVDFARAESHISIALSGVPDIPAHDAITSLEAGLLPIRAFGGATNRRDRDASELRAQIVTPPGEPDGVSQASSSCIELEPVKFVDLLLEDLSHVVVFAKSGACMVNIPDPARFAVHNLVVCGGESMPERLTSISLLDQAAALIEWHMDQQRIAQFREVWRDAQVRGSVWRESAYRGRCALLERYPALAASFD